MPEERTEETALGVARARFVEGLAQKSGELKDAVSALAAAPDAERPRQELRRRLHALYASAQVFRIEPLSRGLRDGIERLDAARDQGRPLAPSDFERLSQLASQVPTLIDVKDVSRVSRYPAISIAPGASLRPSAPSVAMQPRVQSVQPPVSGRPSAPLDSVVSVLVVDSVEWQTRIRALLPPERFEVATASSVDEALRLARSAAPDIVLADYSMALNPDVELIRRLRSDPLTDFVPVVALVPTGASFDRIAARDAGVDETISKPVQPDVLERAIGRLTGTLTGVGAPEALADLTLEEVADRIAAEIRSGLVDSAETGKDVRIPLGEGAEILAAAWSTVARVRVQVAERSGGRVRFRDSARRGGPAMVALVGGRAGDAQDATPVSLAGRRIIIADDDPAVVWFFAGLLREEGAEVVEADDGRQALEAARKQRPDLVISDIVMPGMDGFVLCRELRRDPMLADVPVILLSWKEDFLQRMRELRAGASAYLRKEAQSAQILERVRRLLRPRARLEARLRAGGEVRGRIEGIGVVSLLRTVAAVRPNARITARDAFHLFEIDIRGGQLIALTRTASDGSFARGKRALPQLLGCTGGRFTVQDSDAPVRATFDAPLEESLREASRQLGALIESLSGAGLARATRIVFDEDALRSVVAVSPAPVREVVERLQRGALPRDLLEEGIAPGTLESVAVDLARRGAITEVISSRDTEETIGIVPSVALLVADTQSSATMTPASAPSDATKPPEESVEDVLADVQRLAERRASEPPLAQLDIPFERTAQQTALNADEAAAVAGNAESTTDVASPSTAPMPHATGSQAPVAQSSRAPRPSRPSTSPSLTPYISKEPSGGGLKWFLLIAALIAVGFIGWRLAAAKLGLSQRRSDTRAPMQPSDEATPPAELEAVPPSEAMQADAMAVADASAPRVDARVNVAAGHGLLVIEPPSALGAAGSAPRAEDVAVVHYGNRVLGRPPLEVVLPEGRHDLEFRSGDETSYRFVFVRNGERVTLKAPR